MKKKYEQGLTLIEVLSSITILSIVIVGLLSLFPKAYFFTKANQSKTLAVNIARGALHYFEKQDYDLLNGYRQALGDGKVAMFDSASICSAAKSVRISDQETIESALFPNAESCAKILEPTINNITYQNGNIQVFLMPPTWGDVQKNEVSSHIQELHPNTSLSDVTKSLEQFKNEQKNTKQMEKPVVNILVYVDLNEKDDREGVILEGSIAYESLR